MASKGVHFDNSLDVSEDGPKRPSDANSNDLLDLGRESVESGYVEEKEDADGASSGRGTASSLTGSVSSLLEEPSVASPTEEQRQAWFDEIAKIDEEAATLRLVLQVWFFRVCVPLCERVSFELSLGVFQYVCASLMCVS